VVRSEQNEEKTQLETQRQDMEEPNQESESHTSREPNRQEKGMVHESTVVDSSVEEAIPRTKERRESGEGVGAQTG
jgi:hypothetical protein